MGEWADIEDYYADLADYYGAPPDEPEGGEPVTPRLVLLTGPAAGEVAKVLREMVNGDALRYVTGNGPASTWDEVRDYWVAPRQIALGDDHGLTEGRIRSLPGGEEWLVGLVLPSLPETLGYHPWPGLRCDNFPARLAILAPDPPPLLVERARAWGGHCWYCHWDNGCWICDHQGNPFIGPFDTWPEAVRAALGGT